MSYASEIHSILTSLDVPVARFQGGDLKVNSPLNGELIAEVDQHGVADAVDAVSASHKAYRKWRSVPAPRRGELIRLLGEELRTHKKVLGRLVSIEVGKISSEGEGEVQEMIDICDFAVGLSRQLYGLTMATERPGHRMMETWHPLGVVGIITAFNFPVAVWSWNAALALVCGNSVIWKPSEKAPLTSIASLALFRRALTRLEEGWDDLVQLLTGYADLGEELVTNPGVALISATGSTRMGKTVGPKVAARFGRSILELGGNNAAIVTPSADLDLAVPGIAFAAMGTAGQRCTTLRRLIVHRSIYDQLMSQLLSIYESVSVGDPLETGALIGPLIDKAAFDHMQVALDRARELGGTIHGGERVQNQGQAYYVRPALVEMPTQIGPVIEETFAPILYVMPYDNLSEAIDMQNGVAAGLSSSIFTNDMREAEIFVSDCGSDCGIANVNIGPSGAEIGGAFGGEKETGGGRESGSDAWRAYMRRATNTINYSRELPLAQGVSFDVKA